MKSVVLSLLASLLSYGCLAFPEEDEIPFRDQLFALVPSHLLNAPYDQQWVNKGVDNIVFLQRSHPQGRDKVLKDIEALSPENRILILKHFGQKASLTLAKL